MHIWEDREKKIARFEQWTRQIVRQNKKVLRFNAKPDASREDVLEHEAKTLRLAMLLLSYECSKYNPHNLDSMRILYCAATHDDGEGVTGIDHHALFKTDADQENENHHLGCMLDLGIPVEIRWGFPMPIDQDDNADMIHKLFWDGVERIGYVYFALGELQEEEENGFSTPQRVSDFIGVARGEEKKLEEISNTFFSIRLVSRIQFRELKRLISEFKKTGKKLPEPNP